MINKLLIANRGEIAVRIIRTARELGIATVAVYSDADANALHVELADEAVRIGPAPVTESYLCMNAILEAAETTGADAIHPGYGFLSENPDFVDLVEQAGLTFIGPSANSIRAMGLKDQAKVLMERSGVPVVPGYHGSEQGDDFLAQQADIIGYPVLIKARAGGGGKGMRLVEAPADFCDALASAQREAAASFGDSSCLIEKYIQNPRHIEVQVFGDTHGNVVHLFERDCSLQRRHQKVVEEAPAPGMTQELRSAMGAAAIAAAKAVDYVGAGTVEFIVDGSKFPSKKSFWFMEMNTRLQVEHPVTEAITGLDLVALQIAVAEGRPVPFEQEDLKVRGHSIEARLYAEDAPAGFLPATGQLERLRFADENGVRVDTGVREGDQITPFYDPMIAKVIAYGSDRETSLRNLATSLKQTQISGSKTNREFLVRLVEDIDFVKGNVDTGLIERKLDDLVAGASPEAEDYALAAMTVLSSPDIEFENFRIFGSARQTVQFENEVVITVETDSNGTRRFNTPLGDVVMSNVERSGERLTFNIGDRRQTALGTRLASSILIARNGIQHEFQLANSGQEDEIVHADAILSPMPGVVVEVATETGAIVEEGQTLVVLEAMKMEHRMSATRTGRVAELNVSRGSQVAQGEILIRFDEVDD